MSHDHAEQTKTAHTDGPTASPTATPSAIPQGIVNGSASAVAAYIAVHPGQRDEVMRMVIRARGSTFARQVVEVDPGERHEATRSASSDAIAVEIDLLDARVIEAIGHASAGTGNPAEDTERLAKQANDLFELVRGAPVSKASGNLLGPRLHQLDRSIENYKATLAHRRVATTTDGIERWLGYAHQLLGQTVESAKQYRPAGSATTLQHQAIGEHLEAAYEASRSIRSGNANIDAVRLRLHLSSATAALDAISGDHNQLAQYGRPIHKLLDELVLLERMHPEISGTLTAEIALVRKAGR